MINRRGFLAVGAAALAGRVVPSFPSRAAQSPADTYFAWEEIVPGVRIAWGAGAAAMVISSGGESLLVDCKGYGLGTTLRREVEADGSHLVAVVNTHHHAAQIGGNVAFTPDVPVIAQRRAAQRIVAQVEGVVEALREDPDGNIVADRRQQIFDQAHSDVGARQALSDFDGLVAGGPRIVPENYGPTGTFDEYHQLQIGELEVELHHFDRAHTDNDVVVWVPALKVAHVGNLLYIDAHPFIDAPAEGNTRGWQRCLQRAHEVVGEGAIVVPSDGGLLATAKDFDAQSAYFDDLRALAQNALDAGMSRQEAVDFIPSTRMGRFANLANSNRLPVNLGVAYDELATR